MEPPFNYIINQSSTTSEMEFPSYHYNNYYMMKKIIVLLALPLLIFPGVR